jgi:probable rRNA maturation factor
VLDLVIDPAVRPAVRRALGPGALPALRRQVARMVRAASLKEGGGVDLEVTLRLTDDAAIHALNRTWRGKDRATDVLAFAQRDGDFGALAGATLGDIVISLDTAARQARRGLARELLHLSAHGLCHLLGYDHRTDAEEATMNRRARALMAVARAGGRVRAA